MANGIKGTAWLLPVYFVGERNSEMPAGQSIHTSLVISLSAAMLTACVTSQPAHDRTVAANAEAAREAAPERPIDISRLRGRIVFSAGPSQKKEEFYVVNADGSGLRQVTDNSHWDFGPSWSPDGDRIVFRSQRHGNDEIHVIDVNGTGERNISRAPGADWGPDWSPDGAVIAFNSDRALPGELLGFVVESMGGKPRRIGDYFFEYPAWSPDGRRIVFMHQTFNEPGGNYAIAVADADGSGMTPLTNDSADDGWPQWSPDGKRIVFTSVRDDCSSSDDEGCGEINDFGEFHTLYVMNSDGTAQTRVTDEPNARFATWSPDGKYIMFTPAPDGFYIMRPDGSGLTSIPIEGVGASITLFDWTA